MRPISNRLPPGCCHPLSRERNLGDTVFLRIPPFLPSPIGTKEISAGVDEEGNIYLAFDCQEMTDASQFTWCKAYEEIADEERFEVQTEGDQ